MSFVLHGPLVMPATSKKLRGSYWFDHVCLSVCPYVRYAFLRIRYLENRLRYRAAIWYTVSLPYENMLINF